ncbi:SGNH/GDSL hydrolase family protein [Priestia flexa]|uniref:SGNH/GDSL hydrolase family protein n=1 Tax=Priestia flexa TaxID=86664 RepID=UPI003D2B2446
MTKELKRNYGRPLNIIVFGDSITFGQGSISWAEYLPRILKGVKGITNVTITNKAVSGNSSAQQLTLMQSTDLSSYDMVLIMIGTNDIQGSVGESTYSANLQSMITLAKQNSRKVVIGIPPMWITKGYSNTGFASVNYEGGAMYRADMMRLASINDCAVADVQSEIGLIGQTNHQDLLFDNLHPNTFAEMLICRC